MIAEKNRRILIVDDQRAIHDDFRKLLCGGPNDALSELEATLFGGEASPAEHFELDFACQGADALTMVCQALANERPYALAFVDMRMPPGWDGLLTIEKLWSVDAALQIVICTAYSDSSWHDIRQRFGSTDRLLILKKPFDLAEVCQLACAMTEKWRLAKQANLRLDELSGMVESQTRELKQLYRELQCSSDEALSRAERELSKSLTLVREVQEAVVDGILVIDESGRVATTNRRFAAMWGLSPDLIATADEGELLRHAVGLLVDPDAFLALVAHLYGHPNDISHDEIRLKDGRVFERWTGPVRAANGTRYGRLWCFRDITDRRKLEAERAVLTERMASMGRLAASVGHEINNPLAYTAGNIDWLLKMCTRSLEAGPESIPLEEFAEILGSTKDGLARIRTIVRDLQTLARADDETPTDVDIIGLLDQTIQIAANELHHRATVVRRFDGAAWVCGIAGRIGQVFLNLILNAAHAIPEGRAEENTITITCATTEASVLVEVADTGAGILPRDLERIFDPFFTTKAIGSGTGLGLSICRGIIEGHKGTLSVRSRLGEGSTFIVTLPRVRGQAPQVDSPASPAALLPMRRARILIIDDEPNMFPMLRRHLSGHDVVTALDARQALDWLVTGEQFDLILCDLMMANMTGMDFHDEIARIAPDVAGRIVFMTGGAFTPRAKALIATVKNDILLKPFQIDELSRVIGRYVA